MGAVGVDAGCAPTVADSGATAVVGTGSVPAEVVMRMVVSDSLTRRDLQMASLHVQT